METKHINVVREQQHILTFGKYANTPLDEIPMNYLRHISQFDNITPQLKREIQQLLTRDVQTEKDREIAFLRQIIAIREQENDTLLSLLDPKNYPPSRGTVFHDITKPSKSTKPTESQDAF